MEIMTYIALAFSLTGNVLINKRKKLGFVSWLISNILWIIFAVYTQVYAQIIMFTVFSGLAVHGYCSWTNIDKTDKKSVQS